MDNRVCPKYALREMDNREITAYGFVPGLDTTHLHVVNTCTVSMYPPHHRAHDLGEQTAELRKKY